ncbi:MAG: four helix bundle protein [Dehalococcoidia bacterium]
MAEIQSHRDLIVWQKAMDLTVEVYRLAERLPSRETFGIYSQATRAAASVLADIAEGHGRQGSREFANFLSIARGSLSELDTFLELGRRLGYFTTEDLTVTTGLSQEVGKMTTTLRRNLASR